MNRNVRRDPSRSRQSPRADRKGRDPRGKDYKGWSKKYYCKKWGRWCWHCPSSCCWYCWSGSAGCFVPVDSFDEEPSDEEEVEELPRNSNLIPEIDDEDDEPVLPRRKSRKPLRDDDE